MRVGSAFMGAFLYALSSGFWFCPLSGANAGGKSDGTLGKGVQPYSGHFEVKGDHGRVKGGNLFHSFDQFSIENGESATFTPPSNVPDGGVANIISRVTGRLSDSGKPELTVIDGRLTVSGMPHADFWFINPAGVMFGAEAKINVPGAFHVSTADAVHFPLGKTFSATNVGESTLSVARPEAFGFTSERPQPITMEGTVLTCGGDNCTPPKAVSIVSGSFSMTAAEILPAESGEVRIVSVGGPWVVGLTETGVDVSGVGKFANISMASDSNIEIPSDGHIMIRGNRFVMDSSYLSTNITGTEDATGTGIDIALTGPLKMKSGQIKATTKGSGNAAKISIRANGISMTRHAIVNADSLEDKKAPSAALGDAGDIVLDGGRGRVVIDGNSQEDQSAVTSNANENAEGVAGNAGKIEIRGGDVVFRGGAQIQTTNFSEEGGRDNLTAGDVAISARNIRIDGDIDTVPSTKEEPNGKEVPSVTAIFANVESGDAAAGAGDVHLIATERIVVTDGGQIQVVTAGTGDSGTITLRAGETIRLDDRADLRSTAAQSKGGDVRLESGRSIVIGNATLNAAVNDGDRPGGAVTISAGDQVRIGRSAISTTTNSSEKAGDIAISAGHFVRIDDGSKIESNGENGTSGSIRVDSGNDTEIDRSRVSARVATDLNINGNPIDIRAGRNLEIRSGSEITARSDAAGNAGDINLSAGRLIFLEKSKVTTEAGGASGGNITLKVPRNAPSIIDLADSRITSSVAGAEDTVGGDITIDPRFLILDNSQILAQANFGRGGNISIDAEFVFRFNSLIDASADEGIDGTVIISAPEFDIQKGLVELPVVFVDAASQVRQSCEARRSTGESEFTNTGSGGLPPNPAGHMPAYYTHPQAGEETDETSEGGRAGGWQLAGAGPSPLAPVCGNLR